MSQKEILKKRVDRRINDIIYKGVYQYELISDFNEEFENLIKKGMIQNFVIKEGREGRYDYFIRYQLSPEAGGKYVETPITNW